MRNVSLSELRASRWSSERAHAWRRAHWPICGCNYIPRTAVNTTEMWQELDEETIDEELGWARSCGLNSLRVFVQYIVYEADPAPLIGRMDRFLDISAGHGLSVMFALFDDCWNPEPQLGPQPEPIPGVHNSRWTASPGSHRKQGGYWPALERYVTDVVAHFSRDPRVVAWDLYNEPEPESRPLVEAAFAWARAAAPSQPLTTCWRASDLWDIASFHDYEPPSNETLDAIVAERPAICTECINRLAGSTFEAMLPAFVQRRTGWYVWGLVKGRTQTYYPWDSPEGSPEPAVWQHDLLHPDGTPYDAAEVDLIRRFRTGGG